ncbi:GNAT domain-containing protein [Aspergillus pseudonomiae]|uniref:GNAT domain-containing protein n=1 Tax=Aspergillus pseudonomiae TaxID=1506151 RepID=A0A5N7D6R9_9EURO|nr:GNAT domain-containing protein [Aspergillus pseudonomiae]KAE8402035.1 GNAT domain-containing protein [Aspergillus pseudonomiae]
MISFQTARLDIRPLVLSDAEDVFEMRRDPEVAKWGSSGTPDLSISQTIDWMVSRSLGSDVDDTTITPKKKKSGPNVIFAVRELQPSVAFPGGKVIGTMGIKQLGIPLDPAGSNRVRWELGYGFHAGAWGKGYATEAARGVLGHFGEIRRALEGQGQGYEAVAVVEGLWAATAEENLGSQAVLRKCGFEFVGKFVDDLGRKNLDFQVLV